MPSEQGRSGCLGWEADQARGGPPKYHFQNDDWSFAAVPGSHEMEKMLSNSGIAPFVARFLVVGGAEAIYLVK